MSPVIRAVQAIDGTGGAVTNVRLLIFGGRNNDTYLGCLCSEYDSESVLNAYGDHGSRYATDSIWNRFGDFGSDYSSTSACSAYASDPPIVVSSDGTFVGRLTLNRYVAGAITDATIVEWLQLVVCAS